jgi:hypothetical protein
MDSNQRIKRHSATQRPIRLLWAWAVLSATITIRTAFPADTTGVEYFEKKIRPVLAEYCYECHSHKAEKLKAGLYLDSRDGMLRGGESGAAVLPGDPTKSRLIEAIGYGNPDLQMPPKRKLADAAIASLVEWVKMGAPWPEEPKIAQANLKNSPADTSAFIQERRQHWAYQPVKLSALPKVKNATWCSSEIDSFILAKLEENGFAPAPTAERRTLIRRATYDLIGLPPTPDEVEEFLRDSSPDAFAKVVDRLLASPRYGERWARHWLDLVRFSETLGFEFDFDLYNGWRYRDYVIRAFNNDLPYNQFVLEHLAGDLISAPRRDPTEKFNESILATGFFWMGEGRQTPVDIRQEQADVIDGQIDVLGKAFLGQTIACARCHDHKFDAISTRDYYALAGYLKSSRYQQAFIDPPERMGPKVQQLASLRRKIRDLTARDFAGRWIDQANQISRYLMAAQRILDAAPGTAAGRKEAAEQSGLPESQLTRWIKALQQKEISNPDHPLYVWTQLSRETEPAANPFSNRLQALLAGLRKQSDLAVSSAGPAVVFEDFRRSSYEGWFATGAAFDGGPAQPGDIVVGNSTDRPIARILSGGAESGLLSGRFQGELRSQTFTISKPFIHYQVAGRNARVNLIVDGYTLIMNPMYGGLTIEPTNELTVWRTMAVDRWVGQRAFIEISDSSIPIHRLNPLPSTGRVPEGSADGQIIVNQICFSDDRTPPPLWPNRTNLRALEGVRGDNSEALAAAYQEVVVQELEKWRAGDATPRNEKRLWDNTQADGMVLLNWLLQNGLLEDSESPRRELAIGGQRRDPSEAGSKSQIQPPGSSASVLSPNEPTKKAEAALAPRSDELAALLDEYRKIEASIPSPLRAPAFADGTGEDEFVLVRGNHKTPGERAPRRPPEVLDSAEPASPSAGSGRLELARRLVDPSNPLLARVLVNRLWKHHFSEGIVRTPDDFGRMGQAPTHPELLDYLAAQFVRGDWSIKQMHRLMMLTSAYQMSSQPNPAQTLRDPENRLLHHIPVRRLEAEAIRDTILAMAGRLNQAAYGPSVLPYLTPYMEGRGRPNSGPLDGEGRRSIYLNARRNFPVPMLVAFDYPVNFSTTGRRVLSTVPDQALTLMNDPFVIQQAERWAKRILAGPGKAFDQRVESMYQAAFTRSPSQTESRNALLFLKQQAERYGSGLEDLRPWADLCHVLINVKEFIFIN